MQREFFILANVNETQRSSATLSGLNGRQNGKGASNGAGESGNRITRRFSHGFRRDVAPEYFMEISLSLPSSRSSAIA
ncbi:MAG: hypothetical protein ACLT74_05475 [Christensenellales bacterium]